MNIFDHGLLIAWVFIFLIIFPIIVGIIVLPFTPYLIKRKWFNSTKSMPSLIPFWGSVIPLVLVVNAIWTNYINGNIFYEWDNWFTQYSLVSYQSPLLDGKGTWIDPGWHLWSLYLLWLTITACIYLLSSVIALYFARKSKYFKVYKQLLVKSCLIMLAVGAVIALLFSNLL